MIKPFTMDYKGQRIINVRQFTTRSLFVTHHSLLIRLLYILDRTESRDERIEIYRAKFAEKSTFYPILSLISALFSLILKNV